MINNLTLLLKCGPRKAWLCYGKKNSPFLVFLNKEPIYLNNVPPGPPHSVCNRSLALSKYASCWCELSLQYKSKHLCAWLCQWILYTFALQKWITLRFTLPDWILLAYLRLHFFNRRSILFQYTAVFGIRKQAFHFTRRLLTWCPELDTIESIENFLWNHV